MKTSDHAMRETSADHESLALADQDKPSPSHTDSASVDNTARSRSRMRSASNLHGTHDQLDQQSHTRKRHQRVELVKYRDIAAIGEPQWVIDHILPDEAVSMLYGPSGKGKTFQGLDWAFSIATGRAWAGHTVKPGHVVYVAGEGVSGYGVRLKAWEKKHAVKPEQFVLCTTPIRLWPNSECVDALIAAVTSDGIQPVLVVFDTLSKCLSGADENSNSDMRTLLDNAERIVRAWHCAVLLVHHTPKRTARSESNKRGERDVRKRDVPRGAQTLQDGVAMHAYLDGDGQTYAKLTCTKQKDTERFMPIRRTLCMVALDQKAASLTFADDYVTGRRDKTRERVSWEAIEEVLEQTDVPPMPKEIADRLELGPEGRKLVASHLKRHSN